MRTGGRGSDLHGNGLAGLGVTLDARDQSGLDLGGGGDRRAVDVDDAIAHGEAGVVRGAARADVDHQRSGSGRGVDQHRVEDGTIRQHRAVEQSFEAGDALVGRARPRPDRGAPAAEPAGRRTGARATPADRRPARRGGRALPWPADRPRRGSCPRGSPGGARSGRTLAGRAPRCRRRRGSARRRRRGR